MEWLEPWWSTENMDNQFHETFARQLALEVPPGHELFELPARLIGRGLGDDALFEILDGSGRVAVVHLTWSKSRERLPWPITVFYTDMENWIETCMLPEHQEWAN
ncbi:hypothetical protein [Cupriavidus pauculus]|nr:hypothetical protein [Cupriavidus pauculus]